MLYGQSGTGKSTSLRNFEPGEIAIINISKKPLPFKSKLETYNTDAYDKVHKALDKVKEGNIKTVVIDDSTYLMVHDFMRNAKVQGFQKYNDMAKSFFDVIEKAKSLPDDVNVYFIGHTEMADDGREHFKTIGKMLDNYVTLEGEFTIVLKSLVKDSQYLFATHNNGQDTVKSPLGMFEDDYIPNDLKAVDEAIRRYYA